jgi:RNA polymerase sigma-70 factor (ECF subfamily)
MQLLHVRKYPAHKCLQIPKNGLQLAESTAVSQYFAGRSRPWHHDCFGLLKKRIRQENMFGRIAEFRRDELLEIEHLQGRCGGLLQRHRVAVVHFLYRMVQDRAVAEELAIEVFLRIYRATGEGSGAVAQSVTRLFRLATNLALKEPPNKTSQPPPAQLADVVEKARRALACMPGKQRAAVLMHKYHDMDSWQIAEVLGCSESVARSLLLSAYDRLRGRLALYEASHDCDYMAR